MKTYKKLLVAVELDSTLDTPLIERAKDLAEDHGAEIFLLHVIEHLGSYGAAYGVAAGANIEEILCDKAKESLDELAQKYEISESNRLLAKGDSAHAIIAEAESISADLIVVGSHGRHGLALLIGSTADGVVHAASCDVLAVRLK